MLKNTVGITAIYWTFFLIYIFTIYACSPQQRETVGLIISSNPTDVASTAYEHALADMQSARTVIEEHTDEFSIDDRVKLHIISTEVDTLQERVDDLLNNALLYEGLPESYDIQELLDAGINAYRKARAVLTTNADLFSSEEWNKLVKADTSVRMLETRAKQLQNADQLKDAAITAIKIAKLASKIAL